MPKFFQHVPMEASTRNLSGCSREHQLPHCVMLQLHIPPECQLADGWGGDGVLAAEHVRGRLQVEVHAWDRSANVGKGCYWCDACGEEHVMLHMLTHGARHTSHGHPASSKGVACQTPHGNPSINSEWRCHVVQLRQQATTLLYVMPVGLCCVPRLSSPPGVRL